MDMRPVHKERFKKNVLTFGLIFAVVAFIWALTMLKIASLPILEEQSTSTPQVTSTPTTEVK